MPDHFIVYKPFRVLSQFTASDNKKCLADYFDVPKDAYPIGRLDYDSEGLLIVSNDKKLNNLLLDPHRSHTREYWVQVEGTATAKQLQQLQKGVSISLDGKKYKTKKCIATLFDTEPRVPERVPPIRFRKTVADSWIKMILTEGKNRQVRRMTAAVGLPTLRLIRYRIERVTIDGLAPGEMQQITNQELYNLLQIKIR